MSLLLLFVLCSVYWRIIRFWGKEVFPPPFPSRLFKTIFFLGYFIKVLPLCSQAIAVHPLLGRKCGQRRFAFLESDALSCVTLLMAYSGACDLILTLSLRTFWRSDKVKLIWAEVDKADPFRGQEPVLAASLNHSDQMPWSPDPRTSQVAGLSHRYHPQPSTYCRRWGFPQLLHRGSCSQVWGK